MSEKILAGDKMLAGDAVARAVKPQIGFVAIGRNEGARLVACLTSLGAANAGPVVYVDSGSSDDSVAEAEALGAEIINLDLSTPFTAARSRNAGFAALKERGPGVAFVQFIDGDCVLIDGWLETARAFMASNPEAVAVCGRRRERFPDASIYNRLCDMEWASPIGEADACGGDALFRAAALDAAGGYDEMLVAGEEPELCLRLRQRGGRIFRLDAEMTLHDAAMTRFSQFWRRSKRAGHAFAEVSAMHASSPKPIWRRETLRALLWAGLAPSVLLAAIFIHPAALGALAVYPLQIGRMALQQSELQGRNAWAYAGLMMASKFAEAAGVLTYWMSRLSGRRTKLIEYKARNFGDDGT